MKSILCQIGQHQKREVTGLQLGDGFLYSGWVCDREGCSERKLVQGDKVPDWTRDSGQVVTAVQTGIEAMRKEKDNGA